MLGLDPGGRSPFDARGKASAAAPAQARGQNLLDRRLGAEAQRALEAPQPAVTPVIVDRQRIGEPTAGKDKPLLAREIRDVVDAPKRLWMSAASQEAGVEQRRDLTRRHGSVAEAAGGGFDLDQRFEPKEPARTGAHNRNVDAAAARLVEDRAGDGVRADRQRRRIGGNENARAHCSFRWAAATIASRRSRSRRPIGSPSSSAAGERAQLPRQYTDST